MHAGAGEAESSTQHRQSHRALAWCAWLDSRPRQSFGLDSRLQLAYLHQLRCTQATFRPAVGVDLGHQGPAKFFVARERISADHCLELPGGGPAAVVVAIGGEGADQGAAFAFRPQVGIDAQSWIGARPGQQCRISLITAVAALVGSLAPPVASSMTNMASASEA